MTDDPWLTTEELAKRWRIKAGTLHEWRYLGKPLPKRAKIGKRFLYRLSDVIAFEHQQEAS